MAAAGTWTSIGYGRGVGEIAISGAYAQPVMQLARMATEATIQGRMPIPSGGEAVLTGQESDEAVIIAAAWLLTHAR